MSSRSSRAPRRVAALLLPFLMVACQSFGKRDNCDGCADARPKIHEPHVLSKPTLYSAARDLDHLEELIDWRGSVTAAAPSVWGQARLQQYREDFEAQMKDDLGGFKESLQGALARSDQAFLLNATAISAAIETPIRPYRSANLPTGAVLRPPGADNKARDPLDINSYVIIPSTQETRYSVAPTAPADATKPVTPSALGVVAGPAKDTSTDASNVNFFFGPGTTDFKTKSFGKDVTTASFTLEPERMLEQKKRYLDLLAQIRRTNEGDDTADAPGSVLQLMRIPVSVLPGKRTDVGFGAEITMSLAPVLGDDLLPNTFRNLVINDLVHQLGFPITQALDPTRDPENYKYLKSHLTRDTQKVLSTVALISDALVADDGPGAHAVYSALSSEHRAALIKVVDSEDQQTLKKLPVLNLPKGNLPLNATRDGLALEIGDGADSAMATNRTSVRIPAIGVKGRNLFDIELYEPNKKLGTEKQNVKTGQRGRLQESLSVGLGTLVPQFAPGTNARVALPTSQLLDVYGTVYTVEIALGAREAFGRQAAVREYAHLPEVQGYLKEELNAAYDLLNNPLNSELWNFCQPTLVQIVRTRAYDQLDQKRREFRRAIERLAQSGPDKPNRRDPAQLSRSAAFAWAILIDATLLTDKLCGEMKAQAARGGCAVPASDWLPLYLPKPSSADCNAFNDYVKARWPIQVFALDPSIQEQNLADRLSTRRELQLALSLAFSHGYMSFNQLSRYARRLEAEYETIDVNRTAVGFSHGPTTFGWRFYPRFQTPDTPSNLELIGRDLLYGGPNKNQLLRQRRLEPGPRECVALVIMPSFVSSVRIETTSNFFPIANPKHKVFEHTDSVRLGRTVKALTTAGLSDAHCYRDGDAERLVARARQLEARLPMQTNTFSVPTEGTLGGFELFNTSTKSLAPELDGFYGAPGVDARKVTTLFLVGDHFSPLRTKVIVGNVEPTEVSLLSRQVARVVVPPGAVTVKGGKYVSVHIATPYGVSRELLVPVVNSGTTQPDGYILATTKPLQIEYTVTKSPSNDLRLKVAVKAAPNQAIAVQGVFANATVPKDAKIKLSIGPDAADAVTASADTNGTYTLTDAQIAAAVTQLLANRFKDDFASDAEYQRNFPQVIDVKIEPVPLAGQSATTAPVNGVLRVVFVKK